VLAVNFCVRIKNKPKMILNKWYVECVAVERITNRFLKSLSRSRGNPTLSLFMIFNKKKRVRKRVRLFKYSMKICTNFLFYIKETVLLEIFFFLQEFE
jgi:hypothetical protein